MQRRTLSKNKTLYVFLIIVCLCVLFVLAGGVGRFVSGTRLGAIIYSSFLVTLANSDRSDQDLAPLTRNPLLDEAARLKAEDMVNKSYFAHNSPEGLTPWHWLREAGYSFSYAGENLAADFHESEAVEKAWMNSPGHRANILNKNFTEIGIATIEGRINGHKSIFVVQMFGKPLQFIQQATSTVSSKALVPAKTDSRISSPIVKGESVTNLEVITLDERFVAVRNTDVPLTEGSATQSQPAHSWYEKVWSIILQSVF